MKKFFENLAGGLTIGIGVLLLIALAYGLSWIITCGLVALICLCFSLTFDWLIATGIWLVLIILRSIFANNHS